MNRLHHFPAWPCAWLCHGQVPRRRGQTISRPSASIGRRMPVKAKRRWANRWPLCKKLYAQSGDAKVRANLIALLVRQGRAEAALAVCSRCVPEDYRADELENLRQSRARQTSVCARCDALPGAATTSAAAENRLAGRGFSQCGCARICRRQIEHCRLPAALWQR